MNGLRSKLKQSWVLFLWLGLMPVLLTPQHAMAAGGIVANRERFQDKDFTFDFFNAPRAEDNPGGGNIIQASSIQLPALEGLGISYNMVTVEPCGVSLPHVHPRSTEFSVMVKGSSLRFGFAEENPSRRTVIFTLRPGQAAFVPQGLIHFAQNLGCEEAVFFAAQSSDDPGTVTIASHLFDFPDDTIGVSLTLADPEVSRLRGTLPDNPAKGRDECRAKCGLK